MTTKRPTIDQVLRKQIEIKDRAADAVISDQAARIAELEKALENIKEHGEAMLYIFDRGLPENSIGRNACDNFKNALKG